MQATHTYTDTHTHTHTHTHTYIKHAHTHAHKHSHTRPDAGPCVLFPLATEVQYLRLLLDKTNTLLHFSVSHSLSALPSPPPLYLCFFLYLIILLPPPYSSHLVSITRLSPSFSLSISLSRMPSFCLVRTLTRLSASLDTHHSPCLLFPLTAFVVGRKSDLSPSSLLPSISQIHGLPLSCPPCLPSAIHSPLPSALTTTGPHTPHTHTHTHTHIPQA